MLTNLQKEMLRGLCTPESMPSICLVYGFRVALGGFRGFRLQDTFARGRVSAHNENCWLWTIPLKACDTFPLPPPSHMPGAMNSPRGAAFSANMLWLTPAVLAIGNGAGCGTPPVGSTAAVATPVIAVLLAFLALRPSNCNGWARSWVRGRDAKGTGEDDVLGAVSSWPPQE